MEIKPIPQFDGYYISKDGKIYSNRSGNMQELNPYIAKNGYKMIRLQINGKRPHYLIHRLVALTFITNPNNYPVINHIDKNRQNNCVENLEWCTRKYNMNYGNMKEKQRNAKLGKERKKGKDNPKYDTGKKVIQYSKDGKLIKVWNSIKQAERNLQIYHIGECCQGKRSTSGGFIWKYFEEEK